MPESNMRWLDRPKMVGKRQFEAEVLEGQSFQLWTWTWWRDIGSHVIAFRVLSPLLLLQCAITEHVISQKHFTPGYWNKYMVLEHKCISKNYFLSCRQQKKESHLSVLQRMSLKLHSESKFKEPRPTGEKLCDKEYIQMAKSFRNELSNIKWCREKTYLLYFLKSENMASYTLWSLKYLTKNEIALGLEMV